ncbi:MAG: S8 family serine peptidase [Bacteroidota bacterium]
MRNQHLFFFFFLSLSFLGTLPSADAQIQQFWVGFDKKIDGQFSILQPQEFLSPRAIERKRNLGIPIDETDLPVDASKLDQIQTFQASIRYTSRWENGAVVVCDGKTIDSIEQLSFVTDILKIGKKPFSFKQQKSRPTPSKSDYKRSKRGEYGFAQPQVDQIGVADLHLEGYQGEDLLVAVFDGGFYNVDEMPFFDSLWTNGQMLEGWDFVQMDDDPYHGSKHGTEVLSVMAANLPGLMIGTAPKAQYVCLRTENAFSETLVEEYNWLAAAEYADSLGVDLINSSLGYSTFNDPTMNHTYYDMDGITTMVTRAANWAAEKGMLVVTSAGNDGNDPWFYISSPADAEDAITVASVNVNGFGSAFSSRGPTPDGRIKPDVAARGFETVVGGITGYQTNTAYGTSFSSPLIAGASASLWSAYPDKTPIEIKEMLKASADKMDKPDIVLGNGIPNLFQAYKDEKTTQIQLSHRYDPPKIHYAPNAEKLELQFRAHQETALSVTVQNALGQEVFKTQLDIPPKTNYQTELNVDHLPEGIYQMDVSDGQRNWSIRYQHRRVASKPLITNPVP